MSTETGLDAEGLDAYRNEVSRLMAERGALKAELAEARLMIERLPIDDLLQITQYAKTYASGDAWKAACRALPALAALDASQRPEDAREPAPKMRPVSVASPGNDGFRYEPVNASESPEEGNDDE